MGRHEPEARVAEIIPLIQRAASDPARGFRSLERALRRVDALTVADPLLQAAAMRLAPNQAASVGYRLATESGYRNSVKFGIVLLGLGRSPANRDVLMILGRHDEFTLFSGVALVNTEPDADGALWELAKDVTGWGRIHLVERLKNTTRQEIKNWILREGFRNDIMNEYLAFIAATTGELAGALEVEALDDGLLNAACDIVTALIIGGPAEGIDDYAAAPVALDRLLRHLESRARTIHQFLAVHQIARFLEENPERWAQREQEAWPPGLRERLSSICQTITRRPEWRDRANVGMASTDRGEFWEAERAARMLGIDTFEVNLARLARDPLDGDWYTIMTTVGDDRLQRVLDLAGASLPLADIATGPAMEDGFGREFRAHRALDFIIQELKRFPGQGWRLIETALRSPVIRNRNMALHALESWDRSIWPPDAAMALHTAVGLEPDQKVRARMKELLAGVGQ
jgi:hypothetical protein